MTVAVLVRLGYLSFNKSLLLVVDGCACENLLSFDRLFDFSSQI